MTKEALKLALEALENGKRVRNADGGTKYQPDLEDEAIKALEKALAQPEQEPVAWQWLGSAHFRKKLPKNSDITAWKPLYTTPPQRTWVGLTDEEVKYEWEVWRASVPRYSGFAKGIEAKLKELNHT